MAGRALKRQRRHVRSVILARLALLLVLWGAWEALAASGLLFRDVVPSASAVLPALLRLLGRPDFYPNLATTLAEVAAALLIGAPLGAAIGLALGLHRFTGRMLEPYLHYLAPTPKIILLPILLELFGVGPPSKIALGALSCFFPVALSLAAGAREVDPVLLRVGHSFHLSPAQMVRKIYAPALVRPIATGLRLGFGVAFVGCLLAETTLAEHGLGFIAINDYRQFAIPEMYAVLLVVFAIAAAGNWLASGLARLGGPAERAGNG